MNANSGIIFNVQKFCINDGSGIRTTVFLKGCPLRCAWCHNPEGLDIRQSLELDNTKCINCKKCELVCENGCHTITDEHIFLSKDCTRCGKCITICPVNALHFCGEKKTVDEIMEIVLSDKAFYENSGGGMTISGGEPMMQSDFVFSLLQLAKANNIHTCLETSGYCDTKMLLKAAPLVDIFLYDIKETNNDNHIKYTKTSNKRILENLLVLNEMNCCIHLRCPIIPGINDRKDHFDKLIEIYNSLNNPYDLELMPYHSLRIGKLSRYGLPKDSLVTQTPTKEQIDSWNEYIHLGRRN